METIDQFEFCWDILNEAHKRCMLGYYCEACDVAPSDKREAMVHARRGHIVHEIGAGGLENGIEK